MGDTRRRGHQADERVGAAGGVGGDAIEERHILSRPLTQAGGSCSNGFHDFFCEPPKKAIKKLPLFKK